MESLRENKPLLYSVCGSSFIVFSLAAGWLPDVAAQFEIIDFPPAVRVQNDFHLTLLQNCVKCIASSYVMYELQSNLALDRFSD